ncbi:MAG: diguanylate cyclase [Thermocrinis sp.]|nr:diguanylate cyclase [Thermocrinis sp.]
MGELAFERQSLDILPFSAFLIDKNYRVVFMNKRAKELYPQGYQTCYQLIYSFSEPCHLHKDYPCPIKEMTERGLKEYSVVHKHNTEKGEEYCLVKTVYMPEHDLFLELYIPLKELMSAFDTARLKPELLINSGPLAFFLWENKEGWPVKNASRSVYDLTGYTVDEFLDGEINYASLIHPEDLERVSQEVATYTNANKDFWTHQPYRIVTKDGKVRWVFDHTVSIKDNKGNIVGYYGYVMDISEFYEKEELFRLLAENNTNGVILYDFQEDKIVYANKVFLRTLKYQEEEVIGKSAFAFVNSKDLERAKRIIKKRTVDPRKSLESILRFTTKTGKVKWFKLAGHVVIYRNKEHLLVTLVDITMEKKREKRLFYLAITDKLTKLLNRHAGIKMFENLLYQAQRYGVPFSLLMLDMDNFKKINDELGHLAGDLALREVAKAIKKSIRKSDIAIRWGGEEFLLLLPHTADPLPIGEKLRKLINAISMDGYGPLSVSIGATTYREGDTIDSMIQRADSALYSAKSKGKNRVELA